MNRGKIVALGMIAAFGCIPASAQTNKVEPFEEALREALKQHRAGNISESTAALDRARGILEKVKSEQIGNALPDPPTGWEADEMKVEDVSPFLGGGKVAKKLYKNKTGQQQILLEVYYGSSLIPLVRGMVENEEIAKAQGQEVKQAGGEKVLVKKIDAKNYEINMPMEEAIMVRLTGKEAAEESMMLKMMRDIDRRAIKSLVKP